MSEALVLVVDDEPQILRALQTNLRGAGYDVATAATAKDALGDPLGAAGDRLRLRRELPHTPWAQRLERLDK